MELIFTDLIGVDEIYSPKPAVECLPEWYKETPSTYTESRLIVDGNSPHTIKKCIPVFDAMSVGYVLFTYVDVQVSTRNGAPYFEWPSGDPISFHIPEQAQKHPLADGFSVAKWSNPWSIQTPRGYSSLFVNPIHNPNKYFTIFEGLVDTDKYRVPVNFPFVLKNPEWEGIIPAGTPLAQVIPIKREKYSMRIGAKDHADVAHKDQRKLRSLWFNSYKRQFWQRKEYR